VTWFQLELHNKPVYLFDVDGYWEDWFQLIEKMVKHGFVDTYAIDYFTRVHSTSELAQIMDLKIVK